VPILSQLLKAEMAEREVRSVAYHMKAARFPAYKDLSSFDFAASEVSIRHTQLQFATLRP
jgi:DNA replication protein DnaC